MIPTYAVAQPGGALAFAVCVVLATGVLVMLGSRLAAVVDTRARQSSPGTVHGIRG